MFIRPALIPKGMEGTGDGARFKVRDPISRQYLDEAGEHKPESEYWLRRLHEGGVEIVSPRPSPPDSPDEESAS